METNVYGTMKVLFVTYHYLHGHGGGIFSSRGFINAFSALADEMTLLYPVKNGEMAEGLSAAVRAIPVAYEKSRFRKFLDLLAGRTHRYFGLFDRVLAEGDFDTVVFDSCYASYRLVEKARKAGCRTVAIHHNYQCEYVRDNYRFPLRPLMLFWTRKAEAGAVRGCDLNLTMTRHDLSLLQRHYDRSGKAVFKVIGDFEYESVPVSMDLEPVSDPVYVITGNLGMMQTELSLIPWLEDEYPVLMEEEPEAHVIVAGKAPTERILTECRKRGVEVVDTPADMGAVLARGRYYLCPTSLGSGLKLRIMDGLKTGMPVVTHYVSLRGYESFLDRFVFSYTDAESFRTALRKMKVAPWSREEIICAYKEEFSFEAGVERLRKILQ